MLVLRGVGKTFGGLQALRDVSFQVSEGTIVGLIGPNGAGKTTLLNCVSGLIRPSSGEILWRGRRISGLRPHEVCRMGVGRTFQIPRTFPRLTVRQNLLVVTPDVRLVEYWLGVVGLADKAAVQASKLTFPERRRLELARALCVKPRLLLLDEVAAGLNPEEIQWIMDLVQKVKSEEGVAVLWVEHVMKAVMGSSDRVVVLHHGQKLAEGTPGEIARDPRVVEAYLGERYGAGSDAGART